MNGRSRTLAVLVAVAVLAVLARAAKEPEGDFVDESSTIYIDSSELARRLMEIIIIVVCVFGGIILLSVVATVVCCLLGVACCACCANASRSSSQRGYVVAQSSYSQMP